MSNAEKPNKTNPLCIDAGTKMLAQQIIFNLNDSDFYISLAYACGSILNNIFGEDEEKQKEFMIALAEDSIKYAKVCGKIKLQVEASKAVKH